MGTSGGAQTRAAASAASRCFMARSASITVPDGLAVAFTSATVDGGVASPPTQPPAMAAPTSTGSRRERKFLFTEQGGMQGP